MNIMMHSALSIFLIITGFCVGQRKCDLTESLGRHSSDEIEYSRRLMKSMISKMNTMEIKLNNFQGQLQNALTKIQEYEKRHELSDVPKDFASFPASTSDLHSTGKTEASRTTTQNMSKIYARRSCQEWYQDGFTFSGAYIIDVDGRGMGDPPYEVYCEMTSGYTFVQHNMEEEQETSNCTGTACYEANVTYSASKSQMKTLMLASESCQQLIKVSCLESPLHSEGTAMAWWKGIDGTPHYEWAGNDSSHNTCACGLSRSCVYPEKSCNCDSSLSDVWVYDNGYITNMSALPIQSISFGTMHTDKPLKVKYSIGPLRCHGTRTVSYPASCLDVFLQGATRSAWYIIGEPESLRLAFCKKESFDELKAEGDFKSHHENKQAPSVEVELNEIVLHNLQAKGFVLLKQEQLNQLTSTDKFLGDTLNEAVSTDESFEEKLELVTSELEFVKETMNSSMNEQQNYLNEINEVVIYNQNTLLEQSTEVEKLMSNLREVEGIVTSLDTKVIFHVKSDKASNIRLEVIKYNMVDINEGNGYDRHTGVFTAPVSGVYYIAVYSYKRRKGSTFYNVVRNGERILHVCHADNAVFDTVGKATTVNLVKRDRVWVIMYDGIIDGIRGVGHVSFMGHLLSKS